MAGAQRQAAGDPDAALAWRADYAPALSRKADSVLRRSLGAKDDATAADYARRALARSPLESEALTTLAFAAERAGERERAEKLLEISAARNLRAPTPHLWLLREKLEEQDWRAFFFHADVLMRKPPSVDIRPLVTSVAATPGASEALLERMVHRPPWRRAILSSLARVSPPLALDLVTRLTAAKSPPNEAEISAVVNGFVTTEGPEAGYLAWVLLLPEQARSQLGDVYNPGFDDISGPPPFGWELLNRGSNWAIMDSGPDGAHRALYVQFSGRRRQVLAAQLLLLPPGRYRLVTRAYAEDAGRGDQLQWRLGCGKRQGLAELPIPDEAYLWREVGAHFEVPADCPAQSLQLVGGLGDKSGAVQAWFDFVDVRRLP